MVQFLSECYVREILREYLEMLQKNKAKSSIFIGRAKAVLYSITFTSQGTLHKSYYIHRSYR
jgi:hypothetical protein